MKPARYAPGYRFAERYRIVHALGSGGMGTVYCAVDESTDAKVAIKVLKSHGVDDRVRFAREARLLSQLADPGIVRYLSHDIGYDGPPYLVMEWIEGDTLSAYLRERAVLEPDEVLALLERIAGALAAAHDAGIVHRDLKPANIVLPHRALSDAKIVDFGIARSEESTFWITQTGALVGTPGYVSPEQARGDKLIDGRADVFALGCLAFKCLTGEAPFQGADVLSVLVKTLHDDAPSLRAIRPDVPVALEELVDRMLSKERDDRPQTAREVARQAASIRSGAGGSARPSVTRAERRFVGIVLARAPAAASEAVHARIASEILKLPRRRANALQSRETGVWCVTFGGGDAAVDLAHQAAECAIALREAVPRIRAVVASGAATLEQTKSVPVGDVIDRGLVALDATSDGTIAVDAASAALLRDRFVLTESDGGVLLTGDEIAPGARATATSSAPFAGREHERDWLEQLFETCVRERRAGAVVVCGPAGAGKSRLARELVQRLLATRPDLRVLTGSGRALSSESALAIASEMMCRAAGIAHTELPGSAREKLAERLGRVASAATCLELLDPLARLARTARFGSDAPLEALGPRDAMGDAWLRWLDAECRAGPTLVLVEDLHVADPATVELLERALSRSARRPWLLVALARPSYEERFPTLWRGRTPVVLRLEPLAFEPSALIVRSLIGPAAVEETVRLLIDRAGGNALFLEQLARGVAEGRGSSLPDSLLPTVQARFQTLAADVRRVLRTASVFGPAFWRGGLAAVLGEGAPIDAALDALRERDLVAAHEPSSLAGELELSFRHAVLQEAAYEMLAEDDRRLAHERAGSWLEERGYDDPALLAEHFARAGRRERASVWYGRAAERALEANDYAAALAHAERAREQGAAGSARAALDVLAAQALVWSGRADQAAAFAKRALESSSPGSAEWLVGLSELAFATLRRGGPDAARPLVEQLIAAEPDATATSAYVWGLARTIVVLATGSDAAIEPLLARLERAAASTTESDLTTSARVMLGYARGVGANYDGRLDVACRELERARTIANDLGDFRLSSLVALSNAAVLLELGQAELALERIEWAGALADRIGLEMARGIALHGRAWSEIARRRWDAASALAQTALDVALARHDAYHEAFARLMLARCALETNRGADAESQARAALALLPTVHTLAAQAHTIVASTLCARGEATEGHQAVLRALAELEGVHAHANDELWIRRVCIESLLAIGRAAEARDAANKATAVVQERAAKIEDDAIREKFVREAPETSRLLEIAAKVRGPG